MLRHPLICASNPAQDSVPPDDRWPRDASVISAGRNGRRPKTPSASADPAPDHFARTGPRPNHRQPGTAPKPRPASLPPARVRYVVVAQWGQVYADFIRSLCRQAFPLARVATHGTGADILAALRVQPADILFLDLTLPDVDGVDLLRTIMEEKLAGRVLLGCRRRDEACLEALRDARFDGIVDMLEESAATVVRALRSIAAGTAFVSPVFRGMVVDRVRSSQFWHKLTPAEIRVLAQIGDGSDDREAAVRLRLSAATVQTHRRNIMHKLNVPTSAKLVREAVRLGLVHITETGAIIRPAAGG